MIPNFKAHPWHGISVGSEAPDIVNVFVEIVPSDTIKYEVDKESGYLKVDRPQQFSNIIPARIADMVWTDLGIRSRAPGTAFIEPVPVRIMLLSK